MSRLLLPVITTIVVVLNSVNQARATCSVDDSGYVVTCVGAFDVRSITFDSSKVMKIELRELVFQRDDIVSISRGNFPILESVVLTRTPGIECKNLDVPQHVEVRVIDEIFGDKTCTKDADAKTSSSWTSVGSTTQQPSSPPGKNSDKSEAPKTTASFTSTPGEETSSHKSWTTIVEGGTTRVTTKLEGILNELPTSTFPSTLELSSTTEPVYAAAGGDPSYNSIMIIFSFVIQFGTSLLILVILFKIKNEIRLLFLREALPSRARLLNTERRSVNTTHIYEEPREIMDESSI